VNRVQRRCVACGGVASLAIETATRTGSAEWACPACGCPNATQLRMQTVTQPASAPDADELARRDRELRELRRERDPQPVKW
jgi:predicted RNA-binding Zn-ribbon protein involved in translation (DUF1610 family)